jgi:23S rRNA (uracil1939-C5)-methyltransferase
MTEDLFRRALPNQSWEWLPAPEYALRHRIQLHWNGEKLGFYQRKKHTIVPVNSCPAAVPGLSEAIPRLKEALACQVLPSRPQRWELATGTPPIDIFAIDEKQRIWTLEPDGWQRSEAPVTHHFSDHVLTHRPGSFFQVSSKWAVEAFHQLLTQWDIHGDTLYDLYGGVGLFSVILGDKFNDCILVESNGSAIAHARQNLTNAKLRHQCIEADAAVWMPEFLGGPNDAVLLDPPRTGLPPEIAQRLLKSNAGTIVLIGCDGAAFCRDIQRLSQTWKIKRIAAIDLFPMTSHVECVGLLQRL